MVNYQKEMDLYLEELKSKNETKKLLLHSCCGPCSSYVLEYLCEYLDVTVLFYNPNIYPKEEYLLRKSEQIRLINIYKSQGKSVDFLDCDYDYSEFLACAVGYEKEREGGKRCEKCFELRLSFTAKKALEKNFDLFATTLTVSPHKNAPLINEIGKKYEAEFGVFYLPSDFKKKSGYLRSISLSKEYSLYRQNYCGCAFSKQEEK